MGGFRHETERLVIRDWQDADWAEFFEHTNTPAVMEHIAPVMDEAGRQAAMKRYTGWAETYGHTLWPLERKSDHAILGFCGLKRCDMAGSPMGEFEIGWRLREDAWGQGYAKEAALAVRDLAFLHFGAPRIVALTVERNAPSWGLMRRIGMQRASELDFRDPTYKLDGGKIIVHTLDRSQWQALAS